MPDDTDQTSLEGPVELVDGRLIITIPLAIAGDFVECSKGIGEVRDEELGSSCQSGWRASSRLLTGAWSSSITKMDSSISGNAP